MKTVICKSGIKGWQSHLRNIYANYEEFLAYDETYAISKRLGYSSPEKAWKKNALIRGSTIPSDLQKIK